MGTLVPDAAHTAAKRGFIRTSAQALSTGIPTAGITGAALSSADPATVGWALLAATLASLAAGATSYFSILSKGVPGDYLPEANGKHLAESAGS